MTQITTTLKRIKELCTHDIAPPVRLEQTPAGYQKLVTGVGEGWGEDEPIPYAKILEINGLDDALWCLRAEPQHGMLWRLMAVRFAREVQHLMEDQRRLAALDVAELHVNGAMKWLEPKRARAQAAAPPPAAARAAWAAADVAAITGTRAVFPAADAAAQAAHYAARAAGAAGRKSAEIEREQKQIFLEIVGG